MEEIPRLPDAHLERAKEIVAENRTRKRCRNCYDRGYIGYNQNNMLVPCNKCVDDQAVTKTWRAYVRESAELTELYGDYFEEEEEESQEES